MRANVKKIHLSGMLAAALCAGVLSGCSGNADSIQTESDRELNNNSVATSVPASELNATASVTDNQEIITLGTVKTEAIAYFGSTYGDFLKKGGDEAEFLHGGRYIAACPDLEADAVYVGEWHDDTLDFTLEDDSSFLRLEGSLKPFFTGTVTEMTAEEFIEQLENSYNVTSEYRESAGTAYYVSGSDYLHIDLVPISGDGQEVIIEIACAKDENITPDSYCWIMCESEESNIFADIPKNFTFSSGAGGWSTDIEISEDGTFTGQYHDSDMGVTGEGYPNGTLYICSFSGRFSDPEPTGKDYIYSMKLEEMNIEDEDKIGTEEIVDETLYVYTTPYGFDNADEFLLYFPGAPLSEMTDECRSWIFLSDDIFNEVPVGYYVMYNVGGQEGFTGQLDDAIWYRDTTYEYGAAYANFSPSYYMGSYLSFFESEGSPATVALRVPWDGKSTEPMECKRSWNDDGSRFMVTIEPDEDYSSELLKYVVTVECISDPEFDFSPWGSNEAGRFTAVFVEKKE